MSQTVYRQGQLLGRGDLWIELTDDNSNPVAAYEIFYALYFVDPQTRQEVLIGSERRVPVNPEVGEYYAALLIPTGAQIGCYRIRWRFRELSNSPQETVVMEFTVAGDQQVVINPYSECTTGLIRKLRLLLGDNDPDRTYHFRPPTGEGDIGCKNQVFGYIWTDEELAEFLQIALWKWNMHPPNTDMYGTVDSICTQRPSWQAALLWGALVNAAQMLAYRWTSEEFSVAGDTLIEVFIGKVLFVLRIEDIYTFCKEEVPNPLKTAFLEGQLRVQAVDPATGEVALYPISDVLQHHTGDRPARRIETGDASVVATCDHSLFRPSGPGIVAVRADELKVGEPLATVTAGKLKAAPILGSFEEAPLEVSYDLCVPGPENFVLANGIVAHNSYSIGGISLDVEKSSKYMDLKQNAEDQWDKLVEAKQLTVKYIRGLKQHRFGVGIKSAFGPNLGKGILSPKSFMISLLAAGMGYTGAGAYYDAYILSALWGVV